MRYPVDNYRITQTFNDPVGHGGLDLANVAGTPILSPVTGTVISVGTKENYIGGLYVIVREDSPNRYEYYTGHHRKTLVSVGQRVTEGQQIAEMGMTGKATGPHTHFQIRRFNAGDLINPVDVYNEYNKGGSMTDLGQARILAYHILGRISNPNALAGECDADLSANHVGKDASAKIWEFYNSPEGKNWREVRLPKFVSDLATTQNNLTVVTADRDNLITKYDASQARIAELEAQLAEKPTVVPDTKWETLKSLIKELFGR